MSFLDYVGKIVCKYAFIVLIFSFLSTLQISFIEPRLKKALGVGDPSEHKVDTMNIMIKTIVFFTGILILWLLFREHLLKCTDYKSS
jgi:hypothetical protein